MGAPRSVSPGSSVQNPGLVFRCDIGQPCLILNVDKGKNTFIAQSRRAFTNGTNTCDCNKIWLYFNNLMCNNKYDFLHYF